MERLVEPVVDIKYEIARKIITNLKENGLISSEEFKKIDQINRETFVEDIASN